MPLTVRATLSEQQRSEIQTELERILSSDSFCNSRQSDRLLRYLVKQSLDNREELLRERVIGVDVFGREPGYDTNEESIVRVRVNELRKRLAKYYQEATVRGEVRFTIPTGSYRVEFAPLTNVENVKAVANGAPAPAEAAVAAPAPSALERFWRPALLSSRPVVICSPHPVLYGFTREFRDRCNGSGISHMRAQTEPLQLSPEQPLLWKDVVTIRDQYIGMGSAHAIASITGLLAERHKPRTTRFGNDVSFEDFRNTPTVLVAAFSNHWTMEMTADWRFVFAESEGKPVVRDRATGEQFGLDSLTASGCTEEDYAIVSRVFQSKTGELLIAAAGITQYGTCCAGEFLVDAALMERTFREADSAWPERNIQVLLHASVIGQVPGPPEVLAFHVW